MQKETLRKLLVGVAVVLAPPLVCAAQQAGSVDLTQIEARRDLRRPPAQAGDPPERIGGSHIYGCFEEKGAVPVLVTLISLDRHEYRAEDEANFEVRITNIGSAPLKVPFSPHLADLQPVNAGEKFAYSQMDVTLWIVADPSWSADTGGTVTLFGSESHPGTMLTLQPQEWADVIGRGKISFPDNISPLARSRNPVTAMNAQIRMYRDETVLTSNESATVSKGVCLNVKQGPALPVKVE